MDDNRQLLCTFSDSVSLKQEIEHINEFYDVYNGRMFIFYNTKNPKELYITYNVLLIVGVEFQKLPKTISIHRKKQTNTLYTLNALNQLVKDENNGVLDSKFKINWEYYRDSLIITNDITIKIIPIKIFDIIN